GVPQDREQPPLGVRPPLELVPGAVGLEHRLLDEVVGFRRIAGQAQGDAVQAVEVHKGFALEARPLVGLGRGAGRWRRRGLVGRRPDADLVFADAGRRAARRAVRRLVVLTRLAARTGPRALGYVAARRAARAVFAGDLRRESHIPVARVGDALAVQATPDGAACALYGAGSPGLLPLPVASEGPSLPSPAQRPAAGRAKWRRAPPDPRHD